MKTFALAVFVENGLLSDLDTALLIQKKLGSENCLDFCGVESVSDEFLDVILSGQKLDSLLGRIIGLQGQADKALADWVKRQKSGEKKVVPNRKPTQAEKTINKPAPMEYERIEPAGEKYTPTRLMKRLQQQLGSYIESAYPLSDPILVRARRRLLNEAKAGHLLSQEPYVESTPRYSFFKGTYGDLGLPQHIADFFSRLSQTPRQYAEKDEPETILYSGFYAHQAEAMRSFLKDGRDVIVATGTGSGKTECFLLPMLGQIFDEAFNRKESFAKPGVRALILYPMNALVNDQLARLRLLFGDISVSGCFKELVDINRHPTFGMYTGRTPYPGPRKPERDQERVKPLLEYYLKDMDDDLRLKLQRLGRFPAKDLPAFFAEEEARVQTYQTGARQGRTYTQHNWPKRLHTQPADRELLTRQEMVHGAGTLPGNCPDILVTNYSMLEYMLMRPFERPIFDETTRWLAQDGNQLLLILDEAHMYRGAKGAEVAFLLRRLQARLGIHNRPEKLRVICTSATLGSSEEALNNMRNFAADLTGKKPECFATITGTRFVPKVEDYESSGIADILSAIEMDDLHAATEIQNLHKALKPLFDFLQVPLKVVEDQDQLFAQLHLALNGRTFINRMLKETAGKAISLSQLAELVFPGHSRNIKAVEILLTLGTLARKHKDEPGLIPARIHAFFRGLHALYACINPKCSGRQDKPGQPATLGKLFIEPRVCCEACGSRVLELLSCRSCGTAYLKAFAPKNCLDKIDFLWGETEGNLEELQLLPIEPTHGENSEEVVVHLVTGFLEQDQEFDENEKRSFWIALDKKQNRIGTFEKCPVCQPPWSRAKSRINDFRTKGEQPFTALIDAQFSEQPPQKIDKRLPNRGRKVLVFSDGRQKAARLAPALEHSHARDLFRQVLAIAATELEKIGHSSMEFLYPAVLWVCNERGLNLFPAPDENEFVQQQRRSQGHTLEELIRDSNQGFLRPTMSYARALFDEMTDRYYSMSALALSTVEEDPYVRAALMADFPDVGLEGDSATVIFRTWLLLQLEAKRFWPPGADINKIGEGWDRPEGMSPNNEKHLFPGRFADYLKKVLSDDEKIEEVKKWFKSFLVEKGFCRLENDLYFLSPRGLKLVLKLDAAWLGCSSCGRLYPHALDSICPACLGNVQTVDRDYLDARNGYYRQQVIRAMAGQSLEPFGLITAEHSAQLTGMDDQKAFSRTEKYELRFQDIPIGRGSSHNELPIDVLSCTTTMEVGIDIGTLSGVALRNVPPHVANYQQRAGRAGRRGRSIASVLTYAHGTSHDSYYFDNPARIIAGDVLSPVVYIENQQVLRRHVNAYLVQRFFHETVQANKDLYQLFEALGSVEEFLSESSLCCFERLIKWLNENRSGLEKELEQWAPNFSFGLNMAINSVSETIASAIDQLIETLRQNLPAEENKMREELDGLEREVLERKLAEGLLETLISRAILPRYAFPTDVVNFWVPKPRQKGDPIYKRNFLYEPQRDLQLALSEFAPGASLTIDKWRFTSVGIYSPYVASPASILEKSNSYTSCRSCGFVSLQHSASLAEICPCCSGADLLKQSFVTPPGFTADVNMALEPDRGQAPDFAGRASRAQLEVQEPPEVWDVKLGDGRVSAAAGPQNLVTVNKGVGDRGFIVCPECGRTEPVYGKGYPNSSLFRGEKPVQHSNPLERGVMCEGHARGPIFLGHSFITDVLLMRIKPDNPVNCRIVADSDFNGRAGQVALTSLVESLCLAASNTLQIEEGEISGNWCPVMGNANKEVHLFLYDLLPGGAGYTRMVLKNLREVFDETEKLLSGCSCESSCYDCIRHFGNNFIHHSLDRILALDLLRHLRDGKTPVLSEEDKRKSLQPLISLLRLRGYEFSSGIIKGGLKIPLVVSRADGSEILVDVHHPLVNHFEVKSKIRDFADGNLLEYCCLDAFTLKHDLPGAFSKLNL
ncbi:MAG: DEAD/DEAH box helicase [Candidatus Riflebacteria bacterium]